MVERIRSLMVRFPEDEATVRSMIRHDHYFDALCQEYGDIGRELDNTSDTPDAEAAAALADALRKRRTAIEEELLTIMVVSSFRVGQAASIRCHALFWAVAWSASRAMNHAI